MGERLKRLVSTIFFPVELKAQYDIRGADHIGRPKDIPPETWERLNPYQKEVVAYRKGWSEETPDDLDRIANAVDYLHSLGIDV